jgi:hypothetical protein
MIEAAPVATEAADADAVPETTVMDDPAAVAVDAADTDAAPLIVDAAPLTSTSILLICRPDDGAVNPSVFDPAAPASYQYAE